MVISNWTRSAPSAPSDDNRLVTNELPLALARPLDRLAASIIDIFILLIPAYVLLSAPIKKWMTTSFILGSEPEIAVTVLSMIALAVAILVIYQSISHYYYGATIGKRIFDLRVVPMFAGEKVSFWDHVVRAFLWIFEMLCFGLPWLAVFSNPKRRPMHDRFCDTVVVTRAPSGVTGPVEWERAVVRTVFAAMLGFIFLVGAIQVRGTIDKLKMEESLASIVDRDLGDCDVVNASVDEDDADPHKRLKMAMTLYAAGLADRSCLESEVEGEIAKQIPVSPITYLSQAFIYADDAEISNSYLDEVCEQAPGTVECSMSQLVTSWSDEDWSTVAEILKNAPKGSGYMEVWGIRHYMKQAQYAQALETLDSLLTHRELAEFSMVQRVKALFNFYKEPEAVAAFQQAVLALHPEQGNDLSAWMCSQQLQSGCAATTGSACQKALPEANTQEIDFEHTSHALAHVLAMECKSEKDIDYASFGDAVRDSDWRMFFQANASRQNDDNKSSAEQFSQLLASPTAPELLRVEAARRWLAVAPPSRMNEVVETWQSFESREGWVKIGNFLFTRLAEQKNAELALKVAQRLAADESLSPVAIKILAGFTLDAKRDSTERLPASSKVKEKIKQLEEQ